ncbi:MAG TPA: peptidase M23 [Bacteroidales bacterium]|nr:peptidase M23 [Bacteroidales bacterium]
MANNKEKRKYIEKLKSKYRLNILNDQTFEEVWAMRLSRLNVIAFFGGAAILIVVLVIALIAFTPIREFIPGYPDGNTRRNIVINALKADSLERELKLWKDYYNNINNIIRGGEPLSVISKPDSTVKYKEIRFTRSVEDSLLRMQIEENEMYNLSVFDGRKTKSNIRNMLFFVPIKGVITSTFSLQLNHFGVDIVAAPNEPVVAVADGTVTLSTWTLETGYVIQIQHDDNLISVYKHNSQLLKRQGTRVKAGETIAIIGNSGELTTGPHLHFELWYNGNPIDPQKYIVF